MKAEDEITTEHIEYTRTVVPSSMRSPYWKYFGFPSDSANNILTRQKIVCTICDTAIAYNKNTSNLRTHLMARHAELLHKIMMTSGASTGCGVGGGGGPQRKRHRATIVDAVEAGSVLAAKTEFFDEIGAHSTRSHEELGSECEEFKAHSPAYIEVVEGRQLHPIDADNIKSVDYTNFAEEPEIEEQDEEEEAEEGGGGGNNHSTETSAATVGMGDTDTEANQLGESIAQPFTYVDIVAPLDKPIAAATVISNSLQESAVIEMLITDLLPIDTVCGSGFAKIASQLGISNLDRRTITDTLLAHYSKMERTITAKVQQLSQIGPFSLSVECLDEGAAQGQTLNVYFNYYNEPLNELSSVLFCVERLWPDLKMDEWLQRLNLNNCAAIVVSSVLTVPSSIVEFAQTNDFEFVECLESVLTRCLQRIFALAPLQSAFEHVTRLVEHETLALSTTFHGRCAWSKLNYLQFVFDNVALSELQTDVALLRLRQVVDFVKPLKLALDIVGDESLPLCTLTLPLITKLFEEHFAAVTDEDEKSSILKQTKQILDEELRDSIIKNKFLNEATFFDGRFHQNFVFGDDQEVDSGTSVKTQICKRFKHIMEVSSVHKPTIKKEEQSGRPQRAARKSSLKSFFNRSMPAASVPEEPKVQKTNVDLEFERYECEPTLDLEQSPILWWQENAYSYKELHKVAAFYLSIPCCVNRLFRCGHDERWLWHSRRLALNPQCAVERSLWYLHYNRAFNQVANCISLRTPVFERFLQF